MNSFPSSEKLLYLITLCIDRDYVSIYEIMEYFECCYKTASRVMDKIHDIQYDAGWYICEVIEGEDGNNFGEDKMIKIQLERKYQ